MPFVRSFPLIILDCEVEDASVITGHRCPGQKHESSALRFKHAILCGQNPADRCIRVQQQRSERVEKTKRGKTDGRFEPIHNFLMGKNVVESTIIGGIVVDDSGHLWSIRVQRLQVKHK